MAEVMIVGEDVQGLSRKLDALVGELTEGERLLLLAIVSTAGEQIASHASHQDVEGFAVSGDPLDLAGLSVTKAGGSPSPGTILTACCSGQHYSKVTFNF